MQSTAVDFWTMIWEKKSHAVVMLGQLKENGEVEKSKCLATEKFGCFTL